MLSEGHAGVTLSYVPNPFLPPYWETVVLEHGYLPCTITATTFSCEVRSHVKEIWCHWLSKLSSKNNCVCAGCVKSFSSE